MGFFFRIAMILNSLFGFLTTSISEDACSLPAKMSWIKDSVNHCRTNIEKLLGFMIGKSRFWPGLTTREGVKNLGNGLDFLVHIPGEATLMKIACSPVFLILSCLQAGLFVESMPTT